jgi:L-rhamnose isomerase
MLLWDQECHKFGDVIEGFEVEDGLLDGGLTVCGDYGASKAAVLVGDVGVGEHALAGAARISDDLRGCCRP